MKKSIIWWVVSGLMVLSLVLASCAPKVAEEKEVVTEEKEVVTEKKEVVTEKKEVVAEKPGLVRDVLGRLVEAPQYGGTVVLGIINDPEFADDVHPGSTSRSDGFMSDVTEGLIINDPLKGPNGSGEWAGLHRWFQSPDILRS